MEKTDSSPLSRQALYADKKQWNQFLSVFLLAVGVGFTVAGIIFFFAYNWDELPKFAKLGIVEVLLIASVLHVTFTRWNKLVKQILLTGATFLIGTLFAVFGQIYQTGADAYDLFLGWTLFTILWAVATRFAPLWLTFIGLLCTTIWLYNIQIANTNSWEMTLLANAVTWICALATIITEWMSTKGHLDRNNRWFVSLLSLATILHTSFLLMMAICEESAILSVPLISTVLLFSAELWYGWKVKSLFYLAIIPFAALMILLTTFISQSNLRDVQIFFYGGVIVITGTTLLIYIILHLKKHNLTIQVVSIIGGILTAIFFLGFLALARILRSDISCLIAGSILILTTLTISRMVVRSFLDAMNITLYIAGCVLIGFGINASINLLFITLMGISILTFLLSRGFILPFLSVILFNISFFGEAAHVFSSFYPLQIAVVPILGVFLFTNIFENKLFECIGTENYLSKYKSFHFGLFVSGIVSLGGLSINYMISETNSWLVSCILSVCIWIGILIMVQRIMQVMKVDHPVNQVGIYILCIVICLPTVFAPYLSGSLLLILICFHYGYKAECAASLLLFIYAVSKYYYDLNLSLLTKSITLFFIGIACITAWYFFTQKRTRHEKV